MTGCKWKIKEQDNNLTESISKDCGISKLTARLLINRGVNSVESAKHFIESSNGTLNEESVIDPFLMKDMDIAVDRIKKAIANGEKIVVYGDYDVDGITSVTALYSYLQKAGLNAEYYIPERISEGYGMNVTALDKIKNSGINLVITVDCGVMANTEVDFAKSIGLDILITDHHECPEVLPNAVCVVNPKRTDCAYPFKELAGVGVVYKLITALEMSIKNKPLLKAAEDISESYSTLAALGTIADVMPLIGENRLITSSGINAHEKFGNVGIKALTEASVTEPKMFNSKMISYTIAPRINAAGRMGDTRTAVELLLCKDVGKAKKLSNELCEINTLRRETENAIYNDAVSMLPLHENDSVIVLGGEKWHHGVIGIVSSRLADLTHKPCILISLDGEIGKGSGRSVKGFNLFDALSANSEQLVRFGGHALAAGLTIEKDKIKAFSEKINSYAENSEKQIPEHIKEAECCINLKEAGLDTIKEISLLEPFGAGNPSPVFMASCLQISSIYPISNNRHLKLVLTEGKNKISALYFGMNTDKFEFELFEKTDVLCSLDLSDYKGIRSCQLIIDDMRPHESDVYNSNSLNTAYNMYINNSPGMFDGITDPNTTLIPCRDDFSAIYKAALCGALNGMKPEKAVKALSAQGFAVNYFKYMMILNIFKEMKIFDLDSEFCVSVNKNAVKVNLDESNTLLKLKNLVNNLNI